jgi:hypothetical protein
LGSVIDGASRALLPSPQFQIRCMIRWRMDIVDARLGSLISTKGLTFRRRSSGPEDTLVDWFLEQELVHVPPGHRATAFREPRVPSGFPDLVVVIWDQAKAMQWTEERAHVLPSDFRIMQFLAWDGPQNREAIAALFPNYERSLERLSAARMVRMVEERWEAETLDAVFAATQIIAIEAKMREWRSALDQAHVNTWFASLSCVLVPRVPKNSTLLEDARELGIIVFEQEASACALIPNEAAGPRSYVSWLFNDWAWSAARKSEHAYELT